MTLIFLFRVKTQNYSSVSTLIFPFSLKALKLLVFSVQWMPAPPNVGPTPRRASNMQRPAPAFSNARSNFFFFWQHLSEPFVHHQALVFDGMHREMNPFPSLERVTGVFRRSEAGRSLRLPSRQPGNWKTWSSFTPHLFFFLLIFAHAGAGFFQEQPT